MFSIASDYSASLASAKDWQKADNYDSDHTVSNDNTAQNTPRESVDSLIMSVMDSGAESDHVSIPETLADDLRNDDPDLHLAEAPNDAEKVFTALYNT